MKILVSQKVEGISGSEKYLLNLLPALKKRDIDAEFLILYSKNKVERIRDFEEKMLIAGINVHKVAVSTIPSLAQLKKIYAIIRNGSYDLLHSNLLPTDLVFALIKRFFDRKLVLVSGKHGYEEAYTNIYGFNPSKKIRNAYWFCAKISERFINRSYAISGGLYNLFLGLGITKRENLETIPYGFDLNDDFAKNEGLRLGSPQLVIVGRLTSFKGHRYAIQAVKILVSKYPDMKLVIVGSGELETDLKKMVADLGLNDHVTFTGFMTNPGEIMYNSDIVLLPSVAEGFGIVVLEAMSARRPVVAFNVPAPSEVFIHGESGLLATPYLVEEYAKLIGDLIEDEEYRNRLACHAYKQLKEFYNLKRMVDQTIAFYHAALSSSTLQAS